MAKVAGEVTAATLAGQGAGPGPFLAAKQAPAPMMPGAPVPLAERDQAEVEADFDNMPV
mgnify:CR=1 FL=1